MRLDLVVRIANVGLVGMALYLLQFSPAGLTIGGIAGLLVMGIGNAVGLVGKQPAVVGISLATTLGGFFFFVSSVGLTSIPVFYIILLVLAPSFLIGLVVK